MRIAVVLAMTALAVIELGVPAPRPDPPAAARSRAVAMAVPHTDEPRLPARPGLEVRVTAGGAPLADVPVFLADGSGPAVTTIRTDREGRARFPAVAAGPHELWAARDGEVSPIARVVAVDAPIELALGPATNVHGALVAARRTAAPKPDKPGELAGATVTLVPLDVDHAARVTGVDEHGRFAIAGVPRGRWRVESAAAGFAAMTEPILEVAGAEVPVTITLQPTGSVRGVVVDSRGDPIAHAAIVLRGETRQRSVALAPSTARWIHPLAGARTNLIEPARFGANRPGARPTECGHGHCGVDLVMPRGTVVHAVADGEIAAVFSESRTEAGKVVVLHHGGGLKTFYMHLDEVRPGLEVGRAIRAGEPVGTLGSTGFPRGASPPHVHFAVTHEHAGRTWYLDPEPLLRHAVVLPAPRELVPFEASAIVDEAVAALKPVVTSITTDAHGAFHVEDVAPGAYVAAAFASDFAPGASAPFEVAAGAASSVGVTLLAGVTLRGVVIGRDGPLAGATVFAGAGLGESAHKIATTTTDRDGRFLLRALAGTVTITANAPRYGEAERTIVVDDRAAREPLRLDVQLQDAQLRGQVLAPDGGAAPGVAVRVVEGATRRRTITDAAGRFVLERVVGGAYTIELSSPDHPPKRVALDTRAWRDVRLDAGGGVRGRVLDAQTAAPLAATRVELTGPAGQTATRVTDARGAFELRGLAPGDWKLAARVPGYLASSQLVTIRADRTPPEVELAVSRGAVVAGVVRDRYGRRVANARVSIGPAVTHADADGDFRLANAPTGAVLVVAESDGARGALTLELRPNDERVALTVELQ